MPSLGRGAAPSCSASGHIQVALYLLARPPTQKVGSATHRVPPEEQPASTSDSQDAWEG